MGRHDHTQSDPDDGNGGTVGYFTSIGIPLPLAYLVCFTEFLGGIGLVLGLFTRLAALGVAAVMVGAVVKVHLPNGFFMNWELTPGKGHGFETNLALLAMALACVIAGGGRSPSTASWLTRVRQRSLSRVSRS